MNTLRKNGFTSLELMIVLTCFGLVVAASWGTIGSMIHQHRLTSAANQVATHLRLAREKAVAEGNNYIVTFRVPNNDYRVWDDEGSDSVFGAGEARTLFDMPTQVTLTNAAFFGANRVIFRPDGTANASGSLRLSNSEYARQIDILASTGKITISTP